MSENEYHGEANEYTPEELAAMKAKRARVVKPERLDPKFRADLVEFAAERIQDVWNDAGPVDAVTLAQNVVTAQEFLWLSLQLPVRPETHDSGSER